MLHRLEKGCEEGVLSTIQSTTPVNTPKHNSLIHEVSPQRFTLLLRQPNGFWFFVGMAFFIVLSTFELEDVATQAAHQSLRCEQQVESCFHHKVQMHPFLFWQTRWQRIPLDRIDDSVYNPTYKEWEVELTNGSSFVMGTGALVAARAADFQRFLAGEGGDFFETRTHHRFSAVLQLLMWAILLFPFYLVFRDRRGHFRSTQSLYVDPQVMIVKKYNLLGMLNQKTLPVALLRELHVKKKKSEDTYSLQLTAVTGKQRVVLLKGVEAQYQEEFDMALQELQSFLADQKVFVTVCQ